MKEATSNQTIELAKGFSFILEIMISGNSNLSKKELIEVLKFCYGNKTTIHIFNRNTDLIKQMCNCIRELNESQGLKLMKTFNCFIVNNLFSERSNGFNQSTFEEIMKEYFNKFILAKINDFSHFPNILKNKSEKYEVKYDVRRKKKIKPLKFGNSIIIYDEIFSNLINLLEEIAKLENKDKDDFKLLKEKKKCIYKYIKNVCLKYLELMNHKISNIKSNLDESYFKDFLQFFLRALSFFGKLLIKTKENYFANQVKIRELSEEIRKASEIQVGSKTIFVDVITDLIEHIPINLAKLKDECFSNIKNFFTLYPEKMIKNIKKLSKDKFFLNKSKLYYNYENVRSTYFSWISSIKFVLKKHFDLILEHFDKEDYYALFENLCGILFDDNNHLNYVLKVLNCMGTLLDLMKKKTNCEKLHIILSNIIHRLVKYLKNTFLDLEDLIVCLKKIKKNTDNNYSLKKLSELSREELIKVIGKNSNSILLEELINKETFDLRYNREILVQNTVIVNFERGNKLIDFLEETVFKRLSTLNDLILKIYQYYLLEYKKYLKKTSKNFDFRLNYPEYELVRKIFKYNILIIDRLFSNVELFEIDNMPNSIKDIQFKLYKFIHFKDGENEKGKDSQQITMQYRQVYKIMKSVVNILIKTFRNILIKFGKNHQEYYQIILDSLGCHFSFASKKVKTITAKEIENSRFLNKAFFNVIINRIIDLMQKKKFEYFDEFYEKDKKLQDRLYLLTILKAIYRTIKYKYKFHIERFKNQKLAEKKKIFIMDVKEVTLKLILVFMQKTYEREPIFDYLYVLKIIFRSTLKTKEFLKDFAEFVIKHDIRIFEFFKSLYLSKYPELKTIAIDFLNELPIDPKYIIQHQYTNIKDLSWFIDMLIDAIDSSDSLISNKSIHVLFQLFKFYNKKDVEELMTNKIRRIYNETNNIINKSNYKLELFYKKNPNHDYFYKLKNIIKFLGKYSEFLKNARNLAIFKFKSFPDSRDFSFKFLDKDNNPLINDYSIKDFISNCLIELRLLKSKPWFYYLDFSNNYNYYHSNEKFIGLDKLFKFLMSLIKNINLSTENKEMLTLYENILESVYLISFFLRIFKSSEININSTEELEEIKSYINFLPVNEKNYSFLLKFFMRNIFNHMKLKISELVNPLFDYSKFVILKILKTNKTHFNNIFVEEAIFLLNSTDYHKLIAIMDILKNDILPNIEEDSYKNLKSYILKYKKMEILKSIINIANKLDFKFNIKINNDYLDLFEKFSEFILRETDKNKNKDLCSFYRNLNNFKVDELLKRKISLEKKILEKELINIEFKEWEKYIVYYSKFYKTKIEKNFKSLKEFWSIEFLEELKNFMRILNYGLEKENYMKNFFHKFHQKNINPIFELCDRICRENIKYSQLIFKKKNLLIETKSIEKEDSEEGRKDDFLVEDLYYYDYDKKIFVDNYDYFVKEFSNVLVSIIQFLFGFFENISSQDENMNSEKISFLDKVKKKTCKCFTYLLFRLEKKISKAIFSKIKTFVRNSHNTHSDLVKRIFVPLKFIGDKKINEPILSIYFKQLKNFQSHLDLAKIIKIMEQYITEYRKKNIDKLNEKENKGTLLVDFNIIKRFYYIINWIRIIKQSRDILFTELKKALEIELILDTLEEETQTLYPELLNMINKQSNSHFFHHIQRELKTDTDEFFLIYDMFKHKNSICMRERVSREDIIDFILKEITLYPSKPKWLLFLYQISKKAKYFILSQKFPLFCTQYLKQLLSIEPTRMINYYNHFFDRHTLFMKILKNYVEINPFDNCIDLYINKFLLQKNYCLKRDILSIIRKFKTEKETRDYAKKIQQILKSISSTSSKEKEEKNKKNSLVKTFYLTELAPRYLDFFNENTKKYLEVICEKFSDLSEEYQKNADVIDIVSTIKLMAFCFRKFPKLTKQTKIFKSLFTYSWNNIAHPKDNNDKIKNICILMVSTLMNQYNQLLDINHLNHIKPLYDNILFETKIFDNESKLIWLESLGLLLKVYQNEKKEWFKDVLGAHDFNESSLSSKCWQLAIVLRDFFGDRFFDFFKKKFFEERYRSLHENFDTLLIILTYFINNQNKDHVKDFLTENTKINILTKLLDIYIKELKESIYEDKYFNLIVIYLKYFNIIPPFELIISKIIDQKNNDDERYLKFPKIAKQNFILIYYFLKKNIDHPEFLSYRNKVLKYILKHKAVKNLLIHIKYTEIPIIIFNILKICFEKFKKYEHIEILLKRTNQILYNYNKDSRDMMLGVFVYHFLLENYKYYPEYTIINLENILEYVFAHVQSDKTDLGALKRDNQRHYLKGLFDIKDDLIIPHHYSFISLFKFFSITLIKTWISTFVNNVKTNEFNSLCDYFQKIACKYSYENIEIKMTVLNLVKSMIFPEEPIPGWELYALKNLSEKQKIQLLLSIQIPKKILIKEYCNKNFKIYLNKYFELVIKYLNKNSMSKDIRTFITNVAFRSFLLLDNNIKYDLIEKIGYVSNYDCYDIFEFFLNNWKRENNSSLIIHKEGDDIFSLLTIYYSNLLYLKSNKIMLIDNNDNVISEKKDIFEKFLGVVEFVGLNSNFVFDLVFNLFKKKFEGINQEEKEKFIIHFIDNLINYSNIGNCDYNKLCKIFIYLSKNFVNSDLISKLLLEQENSFELLNILKEKSDLTDKEILLIQSIYKDNKNLYIEPSLLLSKKSSEEKKKNFNDFIDNIEIKKKLRKYSDVKNEIEKFLITHPLNKNWEKFSVKNQIIERYLGENWIEAKKNLSEWSDLEKICNNSEFYDLKIDIAINLNKKEQKLNILSDENKPENESLGIVHLMTSMIDNHDLFDSVEELNFSKLKDILFLFNTMYQKNQDINLSNDNLFKILNNHQITHEFYKAFEVMMRKSAKEMNTLLFEWRQRIPTVERTPYEAKTIINQRNFFSDQFFGLYYKYINKNEAYFDITNKKGNDKNKNILDNPLYNKMQILKIERFYNIKPSIDLNKIQYDECILQNTIPSSIYKLYKENYFASKKNNMIKIMSVVNKKYKKSMVNKFRVFDLKMSIRENKLEESFKIVNEIANSINKEGCCGKFFENYFELLYQFMTQSEIYSETLLVDLFDIMSKALVYDYSKNTNPLFYKFLIINYLYGFEKKKKSVPKSSKDTTENNNEGMILEENTKKNKSFSKRIIEILNNTPRKLFKSHILEICSFLDYSDDKNKKVSKLILELLSKEDPFDLYYNIESLYITIGADFFKEMKNNLSQKILPQKIMTYENLVKIVDKYTDEIKISVYILIKQIIEHFYTTGKLENDLSGELIKKESDIRNAFLKIQSKKISAIDKIFSVIVFLENWIISNPPKKKIFVTELLDNNIIYLKDTKKEYLKLSNDYERKKYYIQPYFEIRLLQDNVIVFINLYDIKKKLKVIQVKPYYPHRRKFLVKSKEDMGIYLIRKKILRIFFESFIKNPYLRNYIPEIQNNFTILSKNWYLVDDIDNISLMTILNSHYKKNDFNSIHSSFNFRGKHGPQKAIKKMLDIYPKNIFYNFLLKKMQEPNQIYLFSKKIAGSIAYETFINYIFGFKNHFSDANLNIENGHIYYDINSSFKNTKGLFLSRLTPNFLHLFKYPIIREDFITVLLSLKNELLKKDKNIYLLYSVLILEFTKKPIRSFGSLLETARNYSSIMDDFNIKKIQEHIDTNTKEDFYINKYKLIDRPWF